MQFRAIGVNDKGINLVKCAVLYPSALAFYDKKQQKTLQLQGFSISKK